MVPVAYGQPCLRLQAVFKNCPRGEKADELLLLKTVASFSSCASIPRKQPPN